MLMETTRREMLEEPLWIYQTPEKRFLNYTPKLCPSWLLYISIRGKEYLTVRWYVVYLKHLSALLWETTALRFAARICEAGRMKTSISKIKTLLVPKFIPDFLLTTKRLVILHGKIAIGFACCLASANVWVLNGTVIFFLPFSYLWTRSYCTSDKIGLRNVLWYYLHLWLTEEKWLGITVS